MEEEMENEYEELECAGEDYDIEEVAEPNSIIKRFNARFKEKKGRII